MSCAITFYLPCPVKLPNGNILDATLTRLYCNASAEWGDAMIAIFDQKGREHVNVRDWDEEDGISCVVMTVEQVLAVTPGPPDPSAAHPGLQGRSAMAYLAALPPQTDIAVNVHW
jgi:hypothetical protein